MYALLVLLLLAIITPAQAQITLHNYTVGSDTSQNVNQVSKFDNSGNQLDGAGQFSSYFQPDPTQQLYYRYDIGMSCGNQYGGAPPRATFCGVTVKTSTDFEHWTPIGFLFNPIPYGSECSDTQHPGDSSNFGLCAGGGMLKNDSTHYVFWLGTDQNAMHYWAVWVCTKPGGEAEGGTCTKQPDPNVTGGFEGGTVFHDDDGSAYVAYDCQPPAATTFSSCVMKLNASFTDTVGSPTDACDNCGEATNFLKGPDGTYYVTFGNNCAFCSTGTYTRYVKASAPLGPYGTQTQINANSCQGQPGLTFKLTLPDTSNVWVYTTNQWTNTSNQGIANEYDEVLSFGAGSINPFTCQDTQTIAGITPSPPATDPLIDQTSQAGFFGQGPVGADLTGAIYVDSTHGALQTFTPAVVALDHVAFNVAYYTTACSPAYPPPVCPFANGNLTVQIVTLNQSTLDPISTIGSPVTISGPTMAWNSRSLQAAFTGVTLTPGVQYGIEFTGSNTVGQFVLARATDNPYAGGVTRTSADGGSTWTTPNSGNTDLRFATFTPGASNTGGGLGGHPLFFLGH